jgi:hypothetical protein
MCPGCGRPLATDKPDIRVNSPQTRNSPVSGGRPADRPQARFSPGDRYTYEPPRRRDDIYREKRTNPQTQGGQGAYRQAPQRRPENVSRSKGAPNAGTYRQPQPRRENVRRDDIYRAKPRRIEGFGGSSGAKKAPAHKSKLSKFIDTSSKVVRVVINTIKIAVLLIVIYACIYLIEVYRVKLTKYPYDTSMRLSKSNYGQAISGYFSNGSWRVNPFTAKCTYKGRSNHNEDMELVFSAAVHIELTEIRIDGEPIDARLLESKIMGMFI